MVATVRSSLHAISHAISQNDHETALSEIAAVLLALDPTGASPLDFASEQLLVAGENEIVES